MRLWSVIGLLILLSIEGQAQIEHKKVLKLMGTRFEITAISESEEKSRLAVEAAIEEVIRIENLISSWDIESQTSEINRMSGVRPVKVDKELYDLIYRSVKISNLTQGAFDISFASIERLWKFDGSMKSPPLEEDIQKSIQYINYNNIVLDEADYSVFLTKKGMRIGFGAIGKGYAANKARLIMQDHGIKHGLVNAAGDLTAWGKMGNGEPWKIGISRPDKIEELIAWLSIEDMAVVTSGDYEKYFEYQGKRYSHIIDPRTGYPTSGIKSVTIICPDAELADGLATAVFVMGKLKGIELIDLLKGIECLIITDNNELVTSKLLDLNLYSEENTDGPIKK